MRTFAQISKVTQQNTSAKSTRLGRGHFGQSSEVNSILRLQRTIGNQAVQRLLQVKHDGLEAVSNATAPSHDFSRIPVHAKASVKIQSKLAVNTSGDIYEQEADRISNQVMRMPEPQLQRACPYGGGCPKCQTNQPSQEHERLQTKRVHASDMGQIAAPPSVHEVLAVPGQPLDPATRDFLEPRFGYDFSKVRVHSGATAERSAHDVSAHAYTAGHNVVFGADRFEPGTHEGRRLLAHELTHVVQQAGVASLQRQQVGPGRIVEGGIQRQPISKKEVGRRTKEPAGIGASHAWMVLDALQKRDPVAGPVHRDFEEAFQILKGLWMQDLLITLTELRHSDSGEGQNYLELLLNKTESFNVSNRLVTTMQVVMGSYYAGAIELKEHLSSSDRSDIADYLKRTQTGASEIHLRIIEDLRAEERPGYRTVRGVESATQPRAIQNWSKRVRAAQQLAQIKGVRDKEAIDAYIALLAEALPGKEVHVVKSQKEYRPGVINFDPQPPKGMAAFALHCPMPITTRDQCPEKPKVVLGPKSIAESSPLLTQATLTHEKTHESHWDIVFKFAKKWTSSGEKVLVKDWLKKHRKVIDEKEYHLLKALFAEKYKQWKEKTPIEEHGGVSEILSVLEAFTTHYRLASKEEVKKHLLLHSLSSIAFELDSLRPVDKEYYEKTVYRRLQNYYRSLGVGHRSTFDSILKVLVDGPGSEGQKSIYAQWAEFRRELP